MNLASDHSCCQPLSQPSVVLSTVINRVHDAWTLLFTSTKRRIDDAQVAGGKPAVPHCEILVTLLNPLSLQPAGNNYMQQVYNVK